MNPVNDRSSPFACSRKGTQRARSIGLHSAAASHTDAVDEISLSVPRYRRDVGVVAPVEGGTIRVELVDGVVQVIGDPAGLRDLARWCLSLSDPSVLDGGHIHLDPGYSPLSSESVALLIARHDTIAPDPHRPPESGRSAVRSRP